ncbi:hypothetical protein [Ensifer adhaerens]|uniref:hypothetical protein n=1 Tax=Ensifer adhaerens TaxID=106592 RepID=UPI00132F3328|nr:hypothetical protein [Ensifer adhaerens]QHG70168.1 hypothetical protein DQW09_10055 [Ensifer adhaerens]
MSASNEWTEWHLTPRGWEEGDSKTDFAFNSKAAPADAVQTVKNREYLSSSFSKLEKTSEIQWSSDDKALIAELLAKFGEAPHHL